MPDLLPAELLDGTHAHSVDSHSLLVTDIMSHDAIAILVLIPRAHVGVRVITV